MNHSESRAVRGGLRLLLVEVRLFYAVLVVVTDPHVALLVEIFGCRPNPPVGRAV